DRGDGPVSPPRQRARGHDHDEREHRGHGMRPLRALVSLDDALRMLDALATPIERTERVPLLEALHRVAARDVVAGIDVPLADRAAVDGYAVRAADTSHARQFTPAALERIETLYADFGPRKAVSMGTASEGATGTTHSESEDLGYMVM